jgi:hypothetical protein
MTAKSSIASITHELERMPERVEDARRALDGYRQDGLRLVRRYPGRTIAGAFAVGFILSRLFRSR